MDPYLAELRKEKAARSFEAGPWQKPCGTTEPSAVEEHAESQILESPASQIPAPQAAKTRKLKPQRLKTWKP